jgi:exosortase C (VPDSG-CTERM-specific)
MSHHPPIPETFHRHLKRFGIGSILLIAAFATTLVALVRYALHDDLFSYILLIPFVSAFMVSCRRQDLEFVHSRAPGVPLVLAAISLLLLVLSFRHSGTAVEGVDVGILSLRTLAFVAGWVALAVWTLGGRLMSGLVFPAAFLVFMAPIPPELVELIEKWLQHASAEVTSWLFPLVDVPNFRTGLSFQLPNVSIMVAPECSGIRSTLVLFITSLVAGQLLLERPWQRAVLTLLVIPLGILRNAFRIVTLGWLCTHYGPDMIHSAIHHRGGPVFFAISLLPLFALLLVFRKLGNRSKPLEEKTAETPGVPPQD